MNKFEQLGVSKKIAGILDGQKITIPTEIQIKTIPFLLNQTDDFVGIAKTGTGKTISFIVPMLDLIDVNSNETQVIILVPTRELCQQIHSVIQLFTTDLDIL